MSYYLWSSPVAHPGWLNMAIDATLLDRAERGERWVRLYAWEPTLSFGRHEPVERRYDAGAIAALGLTVVRRPTGGRAVWHADELTYAVAAPAEALGSLREAYRRVHEWLRDAVRSLGVAAELAPNGRPAGVDAGACFASPAGGEVVVGGKKLIGSARLRHGAALLQHGSILLDGDQGIVARVTRGAAPPDRSTTLREATGRPVSWDELAAAVGACVPPSWGAPARPRPDRLEEILERAAASSERFRSAPWSSTEVPDR